MNKLKILLPALSLLFFACNNEEEEIKKVKFWKYSEGISSSDILSFNSKDYSIKNDTIFKTNVPLYKIESHKQRFLSGDQVLVIQELTTGKTARYTSK